MAGGIRPRQRLAGGQWFAVAPSARDERRQQEGGGDGVPQATVRQAAGDQALDLGLRLSQRTTAGRENPGEHPGRRLPDAAMNARWRSGNAAQDGNKTRGWLLGHFIDPAEGVRSTKNVEVKWGVHRAGDERAAWTSGDERTTLVLLVQGRFRISLTEGNVTLDRQGDYAVWGPGIDHSWEAITDSVVVTVRWPSSRS
jgi:quercetin dioxygenase-like cupin family protein